MNEDQPSTSRIRNMGPESFIVHYDPDEDILWVGLASGPAGEEDLHSQGDIISDSGRSVVVTINNEGPGLWLISSLALTNASRHPFWRELFQGLEVALRERKRLNFAVDPSRWNIF